MEERWEDMWKTYEEALNWIHGIRTFGKKPGLKRMEWMMERLCHPEKKTPAIHVAGTNGKGSTVTFIRNMLEEHGLVVGTFTSPFIEVFNERISVNGEPIEDSEIVRLANIIYPLAQELEETDLGGPSEFEVITAMMFTYFGEGHADVAVIEVGLGGLYDSTNIVLPEVSVITTIGMDHMAILGDTLPEIAKQKAGIIKPTVPVVTGNIPYEALKEIKQLASECQSPLYQYATDFWIEDWHTLPTWGEQFTFEDETLRLRTIQLSMLGKHQVENAAAAIKAVELYAERKQLTLKHEALLRGLKRAFWPGRMEKISDEPIIVLDGAHNEPGVERLVETIKHDFPEQEVRILFSAVVNKDIQQMVDLIQSLPNVQLSLTTFDSPKAATSEELGPYIRSGITYYEQWQAGLLSELETMGEGGILFITGSLYFISEVRRELLAAD
ncbi:bifunctional folylpolyglutamate synthase/dihydrofolate synthase [Desemzia incerta]|uniref:bifunctional folylpolyglutamate synthase/dihydrofolate synthase n=1 Tax=Desemzia incerta TaxID=82801 RepID=UPI0033153855